MFQSSLLPDQKNKPDILSPLNKSAFFKPVIQPKLSINQPGDVFEQEADAAADKVMAQPANNDNLFFKPSAPVGSTIQRAPGTLIQRDTIEGTRNSTPTYELDKNSPNLRQAKSGGTSAFANAKLAYDGTKFTVTFAMAWIFPHPWDNNKRNGYVADFERSVLTGWNDRFLLNETGTQRTAHVDIQFDKKLVYQLADSAAESAELYNIFNGRWIMDTRNVNVRDNVNGTTVQLDENANKDQKRKGSDITANASLVVHDGNENKIFTQNTSAHEFGHMIGLGDEYLNDNGTPVAQLSAARAHVNDRIMNVGNRVTNDVYAPFADWLSTLTSTTWTVGRSLH